MKINQKVLKMSEITDFEERYINLSKELGAIWAKVSTPDKIITAEWTRLKCLYGCFNYGRLSCPPHTPGAKKMRRILDSYQKCFIFQFSGKWDPSSEPDQTLLDDEKNRVTFALWHEEKTRKRFNNALITIERNLFLEGYYKALGLGAGPCLICGLKCNKEGHCIHPNESRPSMEACGIDVYQTVHNLGKELSVVNKPESRYYLFGLVLIE